MKMKIVRQNNPVYVPSLEGTYIEGTNDDTTIV